MAGILLMSGVIASAAPSATALTAPTRYASPNGSGSDCTHASPCDIVIAVNDAPSGADVVVLPGQYGTAIAPVASDVVTYTSISVHGVAGKPMPTIVSSANEAFAVGNGSTADNLRIVQVGDGLGLYLSGGSANHVIVQGGSPAACYLEGNVSLFNSVCASADEAAAELSAQNGLTGGATLRNVTAVGTGLSSDAVQCKAVDPGASCQVQLVNTIAQAEHNGDDLVVSAVDGATAKITALYSASSGGAQSGAGTTSIETDSTDISDAPQFVNDAKLNFRQAHGSPTINAGLSNGAFKSGGDLAGLPRVLGSSVDIGAYEFPPPPAVRNVKVTERHRHSLTLTATVLTRKLSTSVRPVAQHGPVSVKGERKVLTGSSKAKVVTLVVRSLNRHTKYAVKVTATSVGGKASGSATATTR